MIYVGQTRSRSLISRLAALGIGEMTNRGELPSRRSPFALDNGAFVDWRAGRPFDEAGYLATMERLSGLERPRFLVAPDVVAGGLESLALSVGWLPRVATLAPVYLAVQDGMDEPAVDSSLDGFAGVFVGGSLPWKLATGAAWVAFAHRHGLPCHVGRVGGPNRIRWAQRIGADSIDSCLPLWSEDNLDRFLRAIRPATQLELMP